MGSLGSIVYRLINNTRHTAMTSDEINDRCGDLPASMANMHNIIIQRVLFGSIKDIERHSVIFSSVIKLIVEVRKFVIYSR